MALAQNYVYQQMAPYSNMYELSQEDQYSSHLLEK